MGQGLRWLALSLSALALAAAPAADAQFANARGAQTALALAPAYQNDYGYWRQQVRVASPSRNARWNSAPPGAVRVYNRRFDARWNWRSAPRYRVVYTYYRGDLWFMDPTTGWAYSVDRYGIVYTADPYRGWVYSLGPLTRWTADLLYFFDLYRFDRGYWYCRDYDYFVDQWEGRPRYGYYTYDTAYSTLWDWEPYFRSSTFITYSNRFSTVWVGQVRSHYNYMERNPYYRRELIGAIGLPAVQAAPPRSISPRALTTTAYWEARDLAAAGMTPPPRGRDTGRGQAELAAGTLVETRDAPSRVVDPGTPAPGFNAPFPDGSYGFGVRPGANGGVPGPGEVKPEPGRIGVADGRGRDEPSYQGEMPTPRDQGGNGKPPQFEEPRYTQPGDSALPTQQLNEVSRVKPNGQIPAEPLRTEPQDEGPKDDPGYQTPRDEPRYDVPKDEPRFEAPSEEPRYETLREEPRYDVPKEEPRYEAPREEPRYETLREEPRYEAPREEPRYEAPREEPRYEAPREEPRYEAPRDEPKYEEPKYEEPKYEEPKYETPKEEQKDDQQEQR